MMKSESTIKPYNTINPIEMTTTNDKFKRFLTMTDHPESFTDEELMELVRDPEMAAWYAALSAAETAAKEKTAMPKPRSRKVALIVGWTMAAAAVLTLALLLWPESQETTMMLTVQQTPVITEVAPTETTPTETIETIETIEVETPVSQPLTIPASHTQKSQARKRMAQAVDPVAKKEEMQPIIVETLPVAQEEKLPAISASPSTESPIPADKQALAELYLAEEALQVAYEQRAVREAVRAYTASIKGEEMPKPVIAF